MTGRSEHKKKVSFLLPTWYTSTIIAIDAKGETIDRDNNFSAPLPTLRNSIRTPSVEILSRVVLKTADVAAVCDRASISFYAGTWFIGLSLVHL